MTDNYLAGLFVGVHATGDKARAVVSNNQLVRNVYGVVCNEAAPCVVEGNDVSEAEVYGVLLTTGTTSQVRRNNSGSRWACIWRSTAAWGARVSSLGSKLCIWLA